MKIKFSTFLLIILLILGGISYTPKTIYAATDYSGLYFIQSRLGARSLDVAMGSTANKANIQIYNLNKTVAQQFRIVKYGNYYYIQNIKSGKVLDAAGGKTANKTNVQQYTWNKTKAQLWTISSAGSGYVFIKNVKSGRVLDVAGGKNINKANVWLYNLNKTNAQKWKLTKVPETWGGWKTKTKATCIKKEVQTRTSNWNRTETREIGGLAAHKYTKKTVTPTTSSSGYDQYTCSVCKYSYKNNYKDPIVPVPLTGISLNKSSATLNVGSTTQLSVTYIPNNTTDSKTVTWSSSNSNVASVSNKGVVTAKKAGSATITAKVGSFSKTCKITVKVPDVPTNYRYFDTKLSNRIGTTEYFYIVCSNTEPFYDNLIYLTRDQIEQFEIRITNITPSGWKNMLKEEGYSDTTLQYNLHNDGISVTCGNNVCWYDLGFYKNGKRVYSIFGSSSYWNQQGMGSVTTQIYKNRVKKLKSQIFTSNMSIREKCKALQEWVNTNTQYTQCGSDEYMEKWYPYYNTGIYPNSIWNYWNDDYPFYWASMPENSFRAMEVSGGPTDCYFAMVHIEQLIPEIPLIFELNGKHVYNIGNVMEQQTAVQNYGRQIKKDYFTIGNSNQQGNSGHRTLIYYSYTDDKVYWYDMSGKKITETH